MNVDHERADMPEATASLPTLEAMGSARSARYYLERPVEPELVRQVIWAGTRASSPNNNQCWDFIVVDDRAVLRRLGDVLKEAYAPTMTAATPLADASEQRSRKGAYHLIENFASVPVAVLVCARPYPERRPIIEFMYSAAFAASQNMLVAARSLGLGAAFTTLHRQAETAFREILGIPDDILIAITMPIGWPDGRVGPVTRRPVDEVIHRNGW